MRIVDLRGLLLMGALMSIRAGFARGVDLTGADRLVVSHKNSFNQPMPLAYRDRLAAIPGIAAVGLYRLVPESTRIPRNDFPKLAVDGATWFDMHRDLWTVPDEQLARWRADRTGAIVGRDLANRFGWTIGSRMPIRGHDVAEAVAAPGSSRWTASTRPGQPAEGMRRST